MAGNTKVDLLQEGFDAWASDIEDRENSLALPQVEIIPLACVWKVVAARTNRPQTIRQFSDDVLASEDVAEVLGTRLQAGDDSNWRSTLGRVIPVSRFSHQTNGPFAYSTYAMQVGRAEADSITPREYVLASLLGAAAYNGGRMLSLEPFGPHPDEPNFWRSLDFAHSADFVDSLT